MTNHQEINKKLHSELEDRDEKIVDLKTKIEELEESFSDLEKENKKLLEMYNNLLEVQIEKDFKNSQQNNSVNNAFFDAERENYEKQINDLNKELIYYTDLLK